jgi:hypothetical protein
MKMNSLFIGIIAGIIVLVGITFPGCSSTLLEGIGIGAAASETIATAEKEARRAKIDLAQELLDTRAALQIALTEKDTEQVKALENKIGELSKDEFYQELGTFIADTTNDGAARDWNASGSDGAGGNLQWLLSAGLGAYALYEKRKLLAQTKGIAKFSAQAPPETAGTLYDDIKKYDAKFIP